MKSMDLLSILCRMDQLIRLRATGCPKEFAHKICISERTLYNYLRFLTDDLGASISYNKICCSYEYEVDQQLDLRMEYIPKHIISSDI
jgi:hypothetical protein